MDDLGIFNSKMKIVKITAVNEIVYEGSVENLCNNIPTQEQEELSSEESI